jgi:hypothetical protein
MELTPNEKKLLVQLRRTETEMFRSRHLLLAVGLTSLFIAAIGALLMVYWSARTPELAEDRYTFVFPAVLLLAIHGAYIFGISIRDWNGNAIRVLLLKLLAEQTESDPDDYHR